MFDLNAAVARLIHREGGYVDHASDPGGRTKYGITEQVARRYGYKGHMKSLPLSKAEEIYRQQYWYEPAFDMVAHDMPRLAEELFDTGVNCGVKRAAEWLQHSLNAFNRRQRDYPDIREDGDIGPRSLSALQALMGKRGKDAETILLRAVETLQGAHYLGLAARNEKFEDFTTGWFMHRIGNVK